jgi:hypothetical protein
MIETRAEKYGRNLAYMVEGASHKIPSNSREDYFRTISKKVRRYSLRPRKEGEPVHEGCRHSMEGIDAVRTDNPREVAAFVGECFDMTYNKQRATAMKKSFLRAIDQIIFTSIPSSEVS